VTIVSNALANDLKPEEPMPPESNQPAPFGRRRLLVKLTVLAVFAGAFGWLFLEYRDSLTLENIARHESQFRQFRTDHPVGVYMVAFLIYVLVTGLSIPGATVLTLTYAWFFGFWRALFVVSFASTAGATCAFLLSRYLLRDTVRRRFGERLRRFDAALEKEGPYYLFTLRLLPIVPFFVVNLVMGLTPIRTWTFYWVSQVGMLAGTFVYVFAGTQLAGVEEVSDVLSPGMIAALSLLGLFPLLARKGLGWVRRARGGSSEER
jgi:uncharacterized membrane protein YdjX (TVP38/TMEM64 family)